MPARQSDALHLRPDRGSAGRHREEHRQGGRGPQAVALVYYGLSDGQIRCLQPEPLPATDRATA